MPASHIEHQHSCISFSNVGQVLTAQVLADCSDFSEMWWTLELRFK